MPEIIDVKMTIKHAKELAIKINGRLPRPGREVEVKRGTIGGTVYKIYLVNRAGRFSVQKYVSVNRRY